MSYDTSHIRFLDLIDRPLGPGLIIRLQNLSDAGSSRYQITKLPFVDLQDVRIFERFDRCRPWLAGKKRHLTEKVARPEHGKVHLFTGEKHRGYFYGTRGDYVHRFSLIALVNDHCAGRCRIERHSAREIVELFLGETREQRDHA